MAIKINDLYWSIQNESILNQISFDTQPGEFIGLIGPNGSGKSSLLRIIFRSLKPTSGLIELNDQNISKLSIKDTAKQIAVVLQERSSGFDLDIYSVVLMGRTPHKSAFCKTNETDEKIVLSAIEKVGLSNMIHRDIQTLSGGELQRVLIARSLAQQAEYLLLDEPTNHLDIRYQLEILSLVGNLNITTIAAMHDLSLSAMFCDRIILLHQGRMVADGTPQQVITVEIIKKVYGIDIDLAVNKVNQQLQISYQLPN